MRNQNDREMQKSGRILNRRKFRIFGKMGRIKIRVHDE